MSQRPKGPGGSPTSSTIPSWSLPHLPEPGLSFSSSPQIRDLPTLQGAPSEPVSVSVHLSVLPARHPTLGRGQGLACRRQWEPRRPTRVALPAPSRPVSARV